jgi:peptide/nickel transport system permease protein
VMGLDKPLTTQFAIYFAKLAHGDLGISLRTNKPVTQLILDRLPNTLELTFAAMAIAVAIAVPAGILAAIFRGTTLDQGLMFFALAGQAIPIFWLALILIRVFALDLGILPVYGQGGISHLILPAVTLSSIVMGRLARLVRSSMLGVFGQDYIRTARAKGLAPLTVIARHALSNAALPIVTLLGLQLAQLLGGAVVTETVFAWPGVGRLVVDAVLDRDFPVVQGVTLVASLIFVTVNTLVDLNYALIDPRIRLEQQ